MCVDCSFATLAETTCEITSTDFQSFVYTSLCFSDTNTPAHWVSTTNYDITLMVWHNTFCGNSPFPGPNLFCGLLKEAPFFSGAVVV